ncbi:hypothetical protein SAY86_004796 [Trapa natans]|uniref:Uncharacterized protein n=1 Tax=Trapa natans TaxID=22666 RepID=A0AAN7RFU5_TRANT|nr:hypothetical protein SAY86_004796 [Trapa natans]
MAPLSGLLGSGTPEGLAAAVTAPYRHGIRGSAPFCRGIATEAGERNGIDKQRSNPNRTFSPRAPYFSRLPHNYDFVLGLSLAAPLEPPDPIGSHGYQRGLPQFRPDQSG